MVIDAHVHVGQGAYKQQSVEGLLREMDACGVDRAVICPVEEQIVYYNREGNQAMLRYQQAHPDRLIGYAVANPWSGQAGVNELLRALEAGLQGVKFNSSIQGFFIHDTIVHPLIAVAREYGVPVYFHCGTPIYAQPFQLRELSLEFPQVNFILGHAGYADSWTDVIPATVDRPNIYLETSHTAVAVLRGAMDRLGYKRMIFGSNTPVNSIDVECEKWRLMHMEAEIEQAIMGDNYLNMVQESAARRNSLEERRTE